TTDFEKLHYGPMNLALMDMESGNVKELRIFPGAKHINPQYSRDGRQLYFVSDRDGFSEIYRLDLASNQVFQVTRSATGISGITPLSPTLTIARQTGLLVFSVFNNGGNLIRSLTEEQAQGTPVQTVASAPDGSAPNALPPAGVLVPVDAAATRMVQAYLA